MLKTGLGPARSVITATWSRGSRRAPGGPGGYRAAVGLFGLDGFEVLAAADAGGADDRVEVERLAGQLGQLGQQGPVDRGQVDDQEGLSVHDVGLVEVGVELPDLPVGQDRDAGIGTEK